jgi:hypothetical protein
VTWAVSEGAAGGTIDTSGEYTAPSFSGTFHVVATSVADPRRSATATVTVTSASAGRTYLVGPTRTYRDLTAVQAVLRPGDTVLVDGNATYPSAAIRVSGTAAAPITFRGVRVGGARPIVSGGVNGIEANGNHLVISGFEITGSSDRCFFHHGDEVRLSDTVIHDCPNGLMGADNGSGSLTMEFVEVYRCGAGDRDHQIYMATDEVSYPGSVFRMQHCYIHDGLGGNNVKSRAERNEIYYNWLEGGVYRQLELIGVDPDGGVPEGQAREDSDVVGNVLRMTGSWYVARLGGDGTGQTRGRYRFVNNTIITQPGGRAVFQLFDGIDSLEMHNNVFYSPGGTLNLVDQSSVAWASGVATIAGTNNWISSGAVNVPSALIGTVAGSSPALTNLAAFDLTPTATSPLRGAAGPASASPPGHPFPSPLPVPAFVPPARTVGQSGVPRPSGAALDIGAYEYAGE